MPLCSVSPLTKELTLWGAWCLVSISGQKVSIRGALDGQCLVTENALGAEVLVVLPAVKTDGHLVPQWLQGKQWSSTY